MTPVGVVEMHEAIAGLSDASLNSLAVALRSGRLTPPFLPAAIKRAVTHSQIDTTRSVLEGLQQNKFSVEQIATLVETVLAERRRLHRGGTAVDVVTTSPSQTTSGQTTAVAVRELFLMARRTVLLAGYAIRQGDRVFATLAERMDQDDSLDVRFFLEVKRPDGDRTASPLVVSRFVEHFRSTVWPGERLPEIYCDPRSVADDGVIRSSLHAKCVVVDETHSFVSSANFTEAGQRRNIEIGVRIEDDVTARRLTEHFEAMVVAGHLEQIL